MDWNIHWFILGGVAYLLVIINLIRTFVGKSKGWEALSFFSLSFGSLTVLEEYRMVNQWLSWGEFHFISNSVPSVTNTLTIAVVIGILLNLVVLAINLKKKHKAE